MTIWIPLFSYFFYQFTRESFWAISTITIVNRRLRDIKYVFIIRIPFLRWINLRPTISAVQAKRIPIVPVRLHSFLLFLLFFFFVFVGEFSSSASDNDFRFQDASLLCLFVFRHIYNVSTSSHWFEKPTNKKKKKSPTNNNKFRAGSAAVGSLVRDTVRVAAWVCVTFLAGPPDNCYHRQSIAMVDGMRWLIFNGPAAYPFKK